MLDALNELDQAEKSHKESDIISALRHYHFAIGMFQQVTQRFSFFRILYYPLRLCFILSLSSSCDKTVYRVLGCATQNYRRDAEYCGQTARAACLWGTKSFSGCFFSGKYYVISRALISKRETMCPVPWSPSWIQILACGRSLPIWRCSCRKIWFSFLLAPLLLIFVSDSASAYHLFVQSATYFNNYLKCSSLICFFFSLLFFPDSYRLCYSSSKGCRNKSTSHCVGTRKKAASNRESRFLTPSHLVANLRFSCVPSPFSPS
jgi:hypothetical protein